MSLSEDLAKLNADVPAFLEAGQVLRADLEAISAHLAQLERTGQLQAIGDLSSLKAGALDIQGLLCLAITVWNIIGPIFLHLPAVPVPSFCVTKPVS